MDAKKVIKDNFFLFKNVTQEQMDELLNTNDVCITKYFPGEIIQSCEICDSVDIVVKGKAVIKSGLDGVIIKKLNKNEVFGVAALFDTPTYTTIVQASTECLIVNLSKSFIMRCIEKNSVIAINYIEFLSQKITFLNKKINAFTAKSAENKLYAYLLQFPRSGNALELNIDMSTIAKMLGVGRATLYRAFEKLENNGTITKQGKQIIFNEV